MKVSFCFYKEYKTVDTAKIGACSCVYPLHTALLALHCFSAPYSPGPMARKYHEMPPLWWIQEQLALSDAHPCGLVWKTEDRYHCQGEAAGSLRNDGRFYTVSLLGIRYPAHRVVYYLRTGDDPGDADVLHTKENVARDNRLELVLFKRRTRPAPRYRRRVRDEEGNLVYKDSVVQFQQLANNTH